MVLIRRKIYKSTVALLGVIVLFFSCKGSPPDKESYWVMEKFPIGEGQNFHLVYTDSMRVRAILSSVEYLDYTNQTFPYQEFPRGLNAELFDKQQKKTLICSNYGVYYPKTNLLELRDSVEIHLNGGKILKTNQLFWSEKQNWVFTEAPFILIDSIEQSKTYGVGMDFNRDFSKIKARQIKGKIFVKNNDF